ncbi:MAG: 50S ribosomal protein L11 methyltransferase [Deltaproteobacteria bacterium]|nr:50S ribosomal protein L11 methyltransferase [Deltaproteobacteria bacterium]
MPADIANMKEEKATWLKIELTAAPLLIDAISNFMTEIGAQGVSQEELLPQSADDFPESVDQEILAAYLPRDTRLKKRLASLDRYIESLSQIFPDVDKPAFKTEVITDPNWGEEWKQYFKPLRVSKSIVIKPTWERYTPQGRDIVIEIDPGMAFGTGQHPSTRMCLEALEELMLKEREIRKWRVLDVGTGTGILGIACAKLGAERAVCVDIDKKAIEIARENAKINEVQDRVWFINRDVATVNEHVDLLIANLTAKLLLQLRAHLISLIEKGGYLILSGIIELNRPEIEKHFCKGSLTLHRVITEKEWVCYILKKTGPKR